MKWIGLGLVMLAFTGSFWGAVCATAGIALVYHGIKN